MSLKNPDYKNILFYELAFTQEKMYQLKEKDINMYEKGFGYHGQKLRENLIMQLAWWEGRFTDDWY